MTNTETPLDPTGAAEPIPVHIPITDSLDQFTLEQWAVEAQVTFERAGEDGGIVVQATDPADARFWTERGELWGRYRDFDDDQSAEDYDEDQA